MSYHLKQSESVPEAIRRIAIEQAELAAKELSRCRVSNRDEAIHVARKSVKRIRCVLRLVRGDLGHTYKRERRKLRSVAHTLSNFRDGAAVISAFDKLRENYPVDFRQPTLDLLRDHLIAHKLEREKTAHVHKTLRKIASRLRAVASRAKTWPLETDGFPAIAPGLQQTFRRGRKTMSRAGAQERPETYHQWRKYLKEQWYHVRLVKDLWTGVIPDYDKTLKQIDDWLDEDHNLSLLQQQILERPCCRKNDDDTALIVSRIKLRQAELRANSLSLARAVYEDSEGMFTRRMNRLWSAWRGGRLKMSRPGELRAGRVKILKTPPLRHAMHQTIHSSSRASHAS